MENSKHTKKYAEKLAQECKNIGNTKHMRMIFISGYMKAIEETAAPDMLEALKGLNHLFVGREDWIEVKQAINAINKATK